MGSQVAVGYEAEGGSEAWRLLDKARVLIHKSRHVLIPVAVEMRGEMATAGPRGRELLEQAYYKTFDDAVSAAVEAGEAIAEAKKASRYIGKAP